MTGWRERRRERRARWRAAWKAERELWQRLHPHAHAHHAHMHRWRHAGPWWLRARLRFRIFLGFGLALALGAWIGARYTGGGVPWWKVAAVLAIAWGVAGAVAWRLTRPLIVTIAAARAIGDGKLDTRIPVGRHGGEMHVLAGALNEMAEKIQRQLSDQRQLLAAVSHELRTPLGHMRVLIETARDGGAARPEQLDQLEREVLLLDDLVARLLASSRLEFGTLDRREVDVAALVADAAVAAGVAPEAIAADGATRAAIDPTLYRRAVANLITNAQLHGGGVVALRIERRGDRVAVEVDDAGPGLAPERRADAFRAFVPSTSGGLGLGLALVSRIAVAHGGTAWTGERPGGGARVGFDVAA